MSQTQSHQIQPAELMDRLLKTERRLSELGHEVEHLQRLATVGTLAAGVAHEINNALTPLLSYAQLAASAPRDHVLREQLIQKAIASVDRVTQITDAILGFARPEEEGQGKSADVASCVDEVFSCLARPAGRDGVETVVEVPVGCRVAMRPVALQQVLMNLVLNAYEAMTGRGGRLWIGVDCSTWNTSPERERATDSPGEQVQIVVEDTGPGVSEAMMGRLFQPFVTSRGGGGGGNGLGLAVCRRLAQEAGGRIWCERGREGVGARFVVELFVA